MLMMVRPPGVPVTMNSSPSLARMVGDMLDSLKAEHDIERWLLLRDQPFNRHRAIVDIHTALPAVGFGDLDISVRRIDPYDLGAQTGHRFGDQTATAPNIEETKALKGTLLEAVTAEMSA